MLKNHYTKSVKHMQTYTNQAKSGYIHRPYLYLAGTTPTHVLKYVKAVTSSQTHVNVDTRKTPVDLQPNPFDG